MVTSNPNPNPTAAPAPRRTTPRPKAFAIHAPRRTKRHAILRTARRAHTATLAVAAAASLSACALPQLVGGMAQSAYLTGETTVPAEYTGLENKTWAVVTLAHRGVQSEVPNVIEVTTNATTRKLVDAQNNQRLNSAGFQPGISSIQLQRTSPSFNAWTYQRMAEELGVDRLIVIDIAHVQLYESGNAYLWDGAVVARLGVVEADTGANDFAFQREIAIQYPDDTGFSTDELPKQHITNTLLDRLSNRAAWTFFEHEEPNVIEY